MKNVLGCVFGVGVFLLLGLTQSALPSGTRAKILFEEKCSICHSIERPKSMVKSRRDWETTVMRMKNDHDGPITADEAQMIIEYLSDEYGR